MRTGSRNGNPISPLGPLRVVPDIFIIRNPHSPLLDYLLRLWMLTES